MSVSRLLGGVLVALVLSSCAAAPECDRIPGVRPGVCPLPVAERQPAPDVTLPVLPSDAGLASGAAELSLAWLDRLEQREKRLARVVIEQPEDLAVPIAQ